VGRYAQVKAIDVLAKGYGLYREQCAQDKQRPWGLTTCGKGPEDRHFAGLDGHTDLGFTQPEALPGIMAKSGAFVISSRYEPWGTVLAEAGFAGLPIVCTEACSAHLDVVRTYYNGVVTPTDDPQAFADGLRWIHDRRDMAPTLGSRSRALADPFGASIWADRWQGVLDRLNHATSQARSPQS
jgi:glycosyltransferase involved in cell wall biosynthesis